MMEIKILFSIASPKLFVLASRDDGNGAFVDASYPLLIIYPDGNNIFFSRL
jgi:hypothetical protein